jgi:hypothetical protein
VAPVLSVTASWKASGVSAATAGATKLAFAVFGVFRVSCGPLTWLH